MQKSVDFPPSTELGYEGLINRSVYLTNKNSTESNNEIFPNRLQFKFSYVELFSPKTHLNNLNNNNYFIPETLQKKTNKQKTADKTATSECAQMDGVYKGYLSFLQLGWYQLH